MKVLGEQFPLIHEYEGGLPSSKGKVYIKNPKQFNQKDYEKLIFQKRMRKILNSNKKYKRSNSNEAPYKKALPQSSFKARKQQFLADKGIKLLDVNHANGHKGIEEFLHNG